MNSISQLEIYDTNTTLYWSNISGLILDESILNQNDLKLFNSFKNIKRKNEFLSVRTILNSISPEATIEYNSKGKPFLLNSNLYIGISHSDDVVGIILGKNKLISIDIQTINSKPRKIKTKYLTNPEIEIANQNTETNFSLLWSAKETLFKAINCEDVDFKSCLNILELSDEIISTQVVHPDFKGKINLNYKVFDTFVMVYNH